MNLLIGRPASIFCTHLGQFQLDGILQKVEGHIWNVGGVTIDNVISSQEVPPTGKRVRIEGLVRDRQTFISRIEQDGEANGHVKIEGFFGGVSQNGTVWRVGGIPVSVSETKTPPDAGNRVKLNAHLRTAALAFLR